MTNIELSITRESRIMEVQVITGDDRPEIEKLEQSGYVKCYENGKTGLNNNVFTTILTKDNQVATVIYMANTQITYIVFEQDAALSERLFYKEEYLRDNEADAKTTLHMLETYRPGSSFVIQLKNKHFIICDGGHVEELPYLIDYLESLTPQGRKPVIEGWFITHPHRDHLGCLLGFLDNEDYEKRIFVDGIYMDIYDDDLSEHAGTGSLFEAINVVTEKLATSEGKLTRIYRPHAGQRYYFSDITVDIMQSMVQVPREKWYRWYRWKQNVNETSAWYMFTIDGQKYLNAGDADFGAMQEIMCTYDQEYLDMNIMAVQHHGVNVHNGFTDYIKVKTLLYPYYGIDGVFKEGQDWPGSWQASVYRNQYLHNRAEESLSYGDGTKVLVFPYKVGTAISLPRREERYEFTGTDKERRIEYD